MFAVRDARPEDVGGIAEAHIESWRVAYRGIVPDAVLDGEFLSSRRTGWAERGRRIAADGPEEGLLALLKDGTAVGFAHVGAERDAAGQLTGCGELHGFYVHPHHWGSGAADTLMDAAVTRLRDLGFTDVVLYAFRDNQRARRFYERSGWVFTGWESSFQLEGHEIADVKYARTLT